MTARHALALGKPVYVVPAPYTLPSFRGGYELLEKGAKLVAEPTDLAVAYGTGAHTVASTSQPSLLLELLAAGPRSAEALGRESGLSPGELMEALTALELEGRVTRVGSGYACSL